MPVLELWMTYCLVAGGCGRELVAIFPNPLTSARACEISRNAVSAGITAKAADGYRIRFECVPVDDGSQAQPQGPITRDERVIFFNQ